ncbi:MAG: hypothetical protein ABL890_04170 [Candidatus Peribacteraceae bacterium]
MIHALLAFILPVASAQIPTGIYPPDSCDFETGGYGVPGGMFVCWGEYAGQFPFILISLGATIAIIMLIINGMRYMIGPVTPGGSSDAAKKGIGAALAGLVLALLSYVILDTIIAFVTQ